MKKFLLALTTLGFTLSGIAQNGANEVLTAPQSSSPYILLDTLFTLENYPAAYTDVYVHFANPTASPVKAVQFRLYYDVSQFTNAVMFWGPTAQVVTDKYGSYYANDDYVNIVAAYTGSNQNFGWADGAMFKLRLFHGSNYNGTPSPVAITGIGGYVNLATVGNGIDVPLNLHTYGGNFQMTPLTFPVIVRNPDKTPTQGVYASAAFKLKGIPAPWNPIPFDSTNAQGLVSFTVPLDTHFYSLKVMMQTDTMSDGFAISIVDAYKLANHVSNQDTLQGIEYYAGDINQSSTVTISDGFAVFNRLALGYNTWNSMFTGVNNVAMLWPDEMFKADTATLSPNWLSKPRRYVVDTIINGLDSLKTFVYVVGDPSISGYNNPATILAKMANPANGTDYILDPAVYLSNKKDSIEFRIPKLMLAADDYLDVPVTVFTFGNKVGALQMGLTYDTTIFEFVSMQSSDAVSKWTSFINFTEGGLFWAGHEDKLNPSILEGPSDVINFKFKVKSPAGWRTSPIAIFNKSAGNEKADDLSMRPSPIDGSIINGKSDLDPEVIDLMTSFIVYPNPVNIITGDWVIIDFFVQDFTPFTAALFNIHGQLVTSYSDTIKERGFQTRGVSMDGLPQGVYMLKLTTNDREKFFKLIKK